MNGDIHNPFMVIMNPLSQALKADETRAQQGMAPANGVKTSGASRPPKSKVDEDNIGSGNYDPGSTALLQRIMDLMKGGSGQSTGMSIPPGYDNLQPRNPFTINSEPQDPLKKLPSPFYQPGMVPMPSQPDPNQGIYNSLKGGRQIAGPAANDNSVGGRGRGGIQTPPAQTKAPKTGGFGHMNPGPTWGSPMINAPTGGSNDNLAALTPSNGQHLLVRRPV